MSFAPESEPPSVAAVIVNWNTRDLLRECLRSLLEVPPGRLGRVVVVDNASVDDSAGMARRDFPAVHLVAEAKNTGYAAGNNTGIRACSEPYLLLLNPDTELDPGALDELAGFLDTHPRCAVVAPQLYSPGGSVQRSCRSFPTPRAIIGELFGISRLPWASGGWAAYRMRDWDHNTVRRVDQPMGSAMMVRRRAIEEVGFMDEDFPLFFNEVDWLFRFSRAGWETWFTPRARVLHHHGSSTRQIPIKAAWLSHTGLHTFYRKHFRHQLGPVPYALIIGAIYLRAALVVFWRFLQAAPRRRHERPQ